MGFGSFWGVLLLGLWDSQCESWMTRVYLFTYGCLWPSLWHMGSPECGCDYNGATGHGSWAPELTMARVARLARVARVCGPRCPELCGTPVPQPEIRPVSPEWKMDSPPLDGQGGPCERSLEMRAWRPREGPWVGQGLRS